MASAVDICNLALAHIGDAASVASIDPPETSVQASACARFYPIVRDLVLEAHAWSFATKRVALAEETNTLDAWRYAYGAPANMIRPLSVLMPNSPDDAATQPYVREALADGSIGIFTNVEQATLRYTDRITDTTKFTPGFVVAVSWLLAHYLSGPVLRSKATDALKKTTLQQYAIALAQASAADGNARKTDTYRNFTPSHLAVRDFQRDESWPIR